MTCWGSCLFDGKIIAHARDQYGLCPAQAPEFNGKGGWSDSPFNYLIKKLQELKEGKCKLEQGEQKICKYWDFSGNESDCTIKKYVHLTYTDESDIEIYFYEDGTISIQTSAAV